jgi:hypothetical protein
MEWQEIVGTIHPLWVFLAVVPILVLTVLALFRGGKPGQDQVGNAQEGNA